MTSKCLARRVVEKFLGSGMHRVSLLPQILNYMYDFEKMFSVKLILSKDI